MIPFDYNHKRASVHPFMPATTSTTMLYIPAQTTSRTSSYERSSSYMHIPCGHLGRGPTFGKGLREQEVYVQHSLTLTVDIIPCRRCP